MNDDDDFEEFEDNTGEDWKDLDAIQRPNGMRAQRRRDWRDVERFREDRELKKFLSTQDWFDDLESTGRFR